MRKILLTLFLSIFLISMVSAAWWNPFTWGDENGVVKEATWVQVYSDNPDFYVVIPNKSKNDADIYLCSYSATKKSDLPDLDFATADDKDGKKLKEKTKLKAIEYENQFCYYYKPQHEDKFLKFDKHSTHLVYTNESISHYTNDVKDGVLSLITPNYDYKNNKPNIQVGYGGVFLTHTFYLESYSPNSITNMRVIDMETNQEVERNVHMKYLTYEEVEYPTYDYINCIYDEHNITLCDKVQNGTYTQIEEVWNDMSSAVIGEDYTVGIFSYVEKDDYVDVDFDYYGESVLQSPINWATWEASLNVSLISYYDFDEQTGNLIDYIGTSDLAEQGTVGNNSGITGTSRGVYSSTNYFNGNINNTLDMNTNSIWSISHWFNAAHNANSGRQMVHFDAPDGSELLWWTEINNNKVGVFGAKRGTPPVFSCEGTADFSENTWNHIVVKHNASGGPLYVYLNGTFLCETGNTPTGSNPVTTLTVGRSFDDSGEFLDAGYIDDLILFKRDITEPEISDIYNNGTSISPKYPNDSPTPTVTVTINNPSEEEVFGTSTVVFNVTATGDNTIDNCTFTESGSGNVTMTNLTSTEWTYTNSSMTSSTHSVIYYCTDETGVIGSNLINDFIVDLDAPLTTIISPISDTYTTDSVLFNITATDSLTEVSTCVYSLDGADNITLTNSGISWSNTNSSMVDGDHTVVFYCNDSVNNINQSSKSFAVDTSPPQVTINSPLNATYYTTTIQFDLTAIDDSVVANCTYSLDGNNNITMTPGGGDDFTSTNSSMVPDELHTVQYYCTDQYGFINGSEQVTFYISTVPFVEFISPTYPDSTVISDSIIPVGWNASSGAFTNVTIFLNYSNGTLYQTHENTSITGTYNFTSVPVGTYKYSVKAFTAPGGTNETEVRTITNDVLEVTLESPADASIVYTPSQNFVCSTDAISGYFVSNVSLYDNSTGTFQLNETTTYDTSGVYIYDSTNDSSINATLWDTNSYGAGTVEEGTTNISVISARYGDTIENNAELKSIDLPSLSEIANVTFRADLEASRGLEVAGAYSSANISVFGNYIYTSTRIAAGSYTDDSVWAIVKNNSCTNCFDVYDDGVYNKTITATNNEIFFNTSSKATALTTSVAVIRVYTMNYSSSFDIVNTTFSKNISGDTLWNCYSCDTSGSCGFATANYTVLSDKTAPTLSVTSPVDVGVLTPGDSLDVNWTVSDPGLDDCWYQYNSINTTVTCAANTDSFLYVGGENSLTFYANDSFGNTASQVQSWATTITFINESYSTETTETSIETFQMNFSYTSADWSSLVVYLVWNDTKYSPVTVGGGDNVYSTRQLTIPSIDTAENVTFFWEVLVTNVTGTYSFNSTEHIQLVSKVNFYICNLSESPQVVFTTYDTLNPTTEINATFSSTWQIRDASGAESFLVQTYQDMTETNSSWAFCISPNSTNYTVTITTTVDASNYTPTTHFIVNETFSGETDNVSLFLLHDDESTLTELIIRDQNNKNVQDAYTTIQKYDLGTDTYYTVGMARSDNDGSDLFYAKWYDEWYRFIVVVDGTVQLTQGPQKISSTPIILNIGEETNFIYDKFKDIEYSVTFNETSENFILTFISPNGGVSSVCMRTIKRNLTNDYVICDDCETSSSATIFCNIAGWGNGTFIANVYATGSPIYWMQQYDYLRNARNQMYEQLGVDNAIGLAILISGVVMTMFLITPALGVFGILAGIGAAVVLGFQPMEFSLMIVIIIMGVAMMWAVQR